MLLGDPLSGGAVLARPTGDLSQSSGERRTHFERELKRSGVVPKAQAGA